MNKRQFLSGAALLAAASPALAATGASRGACASSPILLTVSGAIDRHNRGPLNPTFDRLLDKQMVHFPAAYAFDYPTLASLPTVTIEPTLEYDAKPHRLSGPSGATSAAVKNAALYAMPDHWTIAACPCTPSSST